MIIIETFQRGCSPRTQDRHIMIRLGSMQHPSAAHLLRRLSVGNEHARCRAAHDSRRVLPSPLRNQFRVRDGGAPEGVEPGSATDDPRVTYPHSLVIVVTVNTLFYSKLVDAEELRFHYA
jgi:hypothetical protein